MVLSGLVSIMGERGLLVEGVRDDGGELCDNCETGVGDKWEDHDDGYAFETGKINTNKI